MSRIRLITLAPPAGDSEQLRAARRLVFAAACLGAALLGAAAAFIDLKGLP